MQDIRELGRSNSFQEHNFVLSFIIRELPNNGSKQDPYYVMTKDGLFEIKEYSNDKHSGNQTLITPKGRETFRLILNNK